VTATTAETPASVYDYTRQRISEAAGKPALQYDDGLPSATWAGPFAVVHVSLDRDVVTIHAIDPLVGACLVQASIHAPTRGAVDSVLNNLGERTGRSL